MAAAKRARLDREKGEAVMRFVDAASEMEIGGLVDKVLPPPPTSHL